MAESKSVKEDREDRIRVGLLGCGSIGSFLAKHIERDGSFELSFIYDRDEKASRKNIKKAKIKKKPRFLKKMDEMGACRPDLVIEAASQEAVREYSLSILDHCDLMIMSVGALGDRALFTRIKKKAERKKRKVYIPSGAICGLDGIKSASEGKLRSVVLTTRKPPKGLEGSPWVEENDISLKSIRKPTVIFEGSAKDAARSFPRNVNVSLALSLAGIGIQDTRVRVIADPFIRKNIHEIEAEGTFGRLVSRTENVPSPGNPKTSHLASLSALATLKKLKENVIVGT